MSRPRVSPPTWLAGYSIDELAAGFGRMQGEIVQCWPHERYERRPSPYVSETEDLEAAVRGFTAERPRVISRPCFVEGVDVELDADGRPIPVRVRMRTAGVSARDLDSAAPGAANAPALEVAEITCYARLPKRVWLYGNAPKVADFTEHSGRDGRCMDPLCAFDRADEIEIRGPLYGSQATCPHRRGGFTFRMLPQTRT